MWGRKRISYAFLLLVAAAGSAPAAGLRLPVVTVAPRPQFGSLGFTIRLAKGWVPVPRPLSAEAQAGATDFRGPRGGQLACIIHEHMTFVCYDTEFPGLLPVLCLFPAGRRFESGATA